MAGVAKFKTSMTKQSFFSQCQTIQCYGKFSYFIDSGASGAFFVGSITDENVLKIKNGLFLFLPDGQSSLFNYKTSFA